MRIDRKSHTLIYECTISCKMLLGSGTNPVGHQRKLRLDLFHPNWRLQLHTTHAIHASIYLYLPIRRSHLLVFLSASVAGQQLSDPLLVLSWPSLSPEPSWAGVCEREIRLQLGCCWDGPPPPLLNSCQFMFDCQSLTMMMIVRCYHLNNLMIVYDHNVSQECVVSTEVLVLGTGGRSERIDPKVLALLKSKGIAVEVQDTPNACATFNFLSSERRVVAAGLIPPPISTELE
uniref:NADH:ubiquinone oxidoreductase complex assembly factor n=1 Tax=Oncorhynchus tshawytscha TaxID=74940 RepID=A0AAZ3SSH2_ONCTS